ncbi:aldo/keto reductase [Picosynechococcus sp. PCC 73109]|uniref:aldo/keto reductase n=1 Tax=Picosynechococcus sp. PCC 73109 TaxID=374982 RepID=UPI0007457E69|nr:aldo/keto reductase [Picosynechococcus sp. PCC 73109]AMA07957.1 aldo/keto reductase [Picosynechococcus sp. PCC 73109]
MQYRRFGRTELQMPVFSCGGMRYQFKWQDQDPAKIPADSQKNLAATIRRSLDLGINHIETARGYGTSEMQLGWVLSQFKREDLIIQTKVSPKADPQAFRREIEKSLNYLQLDYVDLFGIHGINNEEIFKFTFERGCLEVAQELQRAGRIRHIGFSTHGSTDLIVKTIETGAMDYVNLHWYWINQDNWRAIEAATQQDMGVFIISPSDKGGHLYNPPQKLVDLCRPLHPMVFNDLFCLSHPQIHTLSVGAARPSDFDRHLETLPLLGRADEILPDILARLENQAIASLGEDWVKTWQVGLPTYDQTPHQINIPVILWLRNLAIAYDMIEYSKARYNLMGNGGHWFPGQKADRLTEVDLRNVLRLSPHRNQILQYLQEAHDLLGGAAVKRLSTS